MWELVLFLSKLLGYLVAIVEPLMAHLRLLEPLLRFSFQRVGPTQLRARCID